MTLLSRLTADGSRRRIVVRVNTLGRDLGGAASAAHPTIRPLSVPGRGAPPASPAASTRNAASRSPHAMHGVSS